MGTGGKFTTAENVFHPHRRQNKEFHKKLLILLLNILTLLKLGKDAFDGNGWEVYDRGERVPPAPNAK